MEISLTKRHERREETGNYSYRNEKQTGNGRVEQPKRAWETELKSSVFQNRKTKFQFGRSMDLAADLRSEFLD